MNIARVRIALIAGSILAFSFPGLATSTARADEPRPEMMLRFLARSREPVAKSDGLIVVREKQTAWDPRKTAIIICDMWDRHTCRGAERREAEIAPG